MIGKPGRKGLPPAASRPAADRHLWQIVPVRDVVWVALVVAGLVLVYELRGVFAPIFFSLLLAYLSNPLITLLKIQWGWPRALGAGLLLAVLALAVTGFGAWLGPLLLQQAQALARRIPEYMERLTSYYGVELGTLPDQVSTWMASLQEDPLGTLQPLFAGTGQALGVIGQVIGTTSYVAMLLFLIPFYFFFFAWYFDAMAGQIGRLIPASRRDETFEIIRKMDRAVTGFFLGRLLIAAVTGLMYAVGWLLTGVPYAFLLGFGTGVLSIIPYVSVIGWPLAILLKYLDATTSDGAVSWLAVVVWPSVPYLIVQFLESWWLTPWIQGRSVDMSAVTVLIVVLIGGAVGGFLGLLLSIPVAACLKILLQDLILPRFEAWAARH
ncbi:AI-2E family transporter [Candidatus Nitrospira bockiana]